MLHRQAFRVKCEARQSHTTQPTPKAIQLDRRQLLASFAAGTIALGGPAIAADGQAVGSYLPSAGVGDFVTYIPTAFQTPALRAGVIKPDERYQFNLPPNFKELRISNTQSGNFCMPRCAEPWTEVVFEDIKVGKIALQAVPLLKLTNAKNPKLADLGTPEQLLTRIGPYLTGNYYDEESLQSATSQKRDDGLEYYQYELLALDAPYGPHSITAVTAKGEVLYMFILQANDKQWSKSEKTLRAALESFRA